MFVIFTTRSYRFRDEILTPFWRVAKAGASHAQNVFHSCSRDNPHARRGATEINTRLFVVAKHEVATHTYCAHLTRSLRAVSFYLRWLEHAASCRHVGHSREIIMAGDVVWNESEPKKEKRSFVLSSKLHVRNSEVIATNLYGYPEPGSKTNRKQSR